MSKTTVGGHITVTIGSTPITLTTKDLSASPMVYTLPKGSNIDISLSDLNTYLHEKFSIPQITFPGISETNLLIKSFSISTAGIFDIAIDFVFGNGQGWSIFPGLKLDKVGFEVDYNTASGPVVTTLTPATGPVATSVVIAGTDLGSATSVKFGDISATPITDNTATSLTVPVPTGATGTESVTVTTAGGTSSGSNFAVTS